MFEIPTQCFLHERNFLPFVLQSNNAVDHWSLINPISATTAISMEYAEKGEEIMEKETLESIPFILWNSEREKTNHTYTRYYERESDVFKQ